MRGIICAALAIYLVGVMLVRMGSRGTLPPRVMAIHPALALVVSAVGVVGVDWSPQMLLGTVALVLTGDLVFKLVHPEVMSSSR